MEREEGWVIVLNRSRAKGLWWGRKWSEVEHGDSSSSGEDGDREEERGKKGRAKRLGEDRSRSWAIVTSIDPISRCLFAHSPLCIKGAVQAAGRPRALHLITWHANRCYGLIRTPRPPSLCIYDYLRTKKKGRWRRWWCCGVCVCVCVWGGWNERGKEAEEEGEEIKYFMMGWCKKKKLKKEERNEVDGSGVCVGEGGWENERTKDGRKTLIYPVWSGKWPCSASWPHAVCLCPNRLIP